jgi:DNA-binding NtrC family response regulator
MRIADQYPPAPSAHKVTEEPKIGSVTHLLRPPGLGDNAEVWMSNFVIPLVEDDPFQREPLADLLKDEGFEVIQCTTAEAAGLIIASSGTELQALITDHKLAGAMSGAALAHYARSRHPQMNIVIMSGATVKPMPVGTTFLQKPFTPERLLDAIRY